MSENVEEGGPSTPTGPQRKRNSKKKGKKMKKERVRLSQLPL